MNRRQFVFGTAGAAIAGAPAGFAAKTAKYDLIVKGGRVIDPSRKLDAVRDVAIAQGRIAAVAPEISAEAAEKIDAAGKLVVPGLIDIHTHATRTKDGPSLCLADGVTGLIDAGSKGADGIEEAIAVARSAPPTWRPPGKPSAGIATRSRASRRGSPETSAGLTIMKCSGARRRQLPLSTCR